ncbi:hypothetical protein Tco_1347401 [Tanacetum coccineum]
MITTIYDIFQLLPLKVQVGVFSTTMPPEALEITRKFINKPMRILVKRDERTFTASKSPYAVVTCGRFRRKGVAINFVTLDDEKMLGDIQKFYNVVVEELPSNVADLI